MGLVLDKGDLQLGVKEIFRGPEGLNAAALASGGKRAMATSSSLRTQERKRKDVLKGFERI